MKRRASVGTRARSTPPATTHLGAAASCLVTLVTETSPTGPGVTAPLAFALEADGRPVRFSLPASTVLVVTDVIVSAPRSNAPRGRYVAAIVNTGAAFHARIAIQMDGATDGFQKTIAFSGGVVFANLPQFQTLASNPSELSVWVYGYLAQRK